MEKDLLKIASAGNAKDESNFDYFQKTAAIPTRVCYNESISQNDVSCELQAKEGVLV